MWFIVITMVSHTSCRTADTAGALNRENRKDPSCIKWSSIMATRGIWSSSIAGVMASGSVSLEMRRGNDPTLPPHSTRNKYRRNFGRFGTSRPISNQWRLWIIESPVELTVAIIHSSAAIIKSSTAITKPRHSGWKLITQWSIFTEVRQFTIRLNDIPTKRKSLRTADNSPKSRKSQHKISYIAPIPSILILYSIVSISHSRVRNRLQS